MPLPGLGSVLGSVRCRRIGRDLFLHRVRSVLIVLSIAVGAAAVGTIAGVNVLLQQNLDDGYAETRPSSASLYTSVPFDQDLVDVVRRIPGVLQTEGRRSATVRLITSDDETIEVQLTALPDFTGQAMDLVTPDSDTWPPRRGQIVSERSGTRLSDLAEGRVVTLRLGADRTKTVTTGGFAHEPGPIGEANGGLTTVEVVGIGDDAPIGDDDAGAAETGTDPDDGGAGGGDDGRNRFLELAEHGHGDGSDLAGDRGPVPFDASATSVS